MEVRELPHNHFALLQASGADDAEADDVAVAFRRRVVVAIRRPAANCRPRLLLRLVRKVRRNPQRHHRIPELAPQGVRRERKGGVA